MAVGVAANVMPYSVAAKWLRGVAEEEAEPVLKMEEAAVEEEPELTTGEAAADEKPALKMEEAVVGELVPMMGDAVRAELAHLVMEEDVAPLSVRMKVSWSWVVEVVFCQSAEAGLWMMSSTRMIEAAGCCCWMSFEDVISQGSAKGLSGVLGPSALELPVQLQLVVVVVQKGVAAPMVAGRLVDMWHLGSLHGNVRGRVTRQQFLHHMLSYLLYRYRLRAFSAWACRQQINHRAEGPSPSCRRQPLGSHDHCCSSPGSLAQAGPGHPGPLAILESEGLLPQAGLPLLLRPMPLQLEELIDRS